MKNIKHEQAKFWKQHPTLAKAQLNHESAVVSPTLQEDFKRDLQLAPCLLEELIKVFLHPLLLLSHYDSTRQCYFPLLSSASLSHTQKPSSRGQSERCPQKCKIP